MIVNLAYLKRFIIGLGNDFLADGQTARSHYLNEYWLIIKGVL